MFSTCDNRFSCSRTKLVWVSFFKRRILSLGGGMAISIVYQCDWLSDLANRAARYSNTTLNKRDKLPRPEWLFNMNFENGWMIFFKMSPRSSFIQYVCLSMILVYPIVDINDDRGNTDHRLSAWCCRVLLSYWPSHSSKPITIGIHWRLACHPLLTKPSSLNDKIFFVPKTHSGRKERNICPLTCSPTPYSPIKVYIN